MNESSNNISLVDVNSPLFKKALKESLREVVSEELQKLKVDENPDRLLEPKEAMKLLGCGDRMLYRHRRNGLKYLKGKPHKYYLKDVIEYREKLSRQRKNLY